MSSKVPNTPFSTRLSGSAKETELRLRSIFQWKKKRPPVVLVVLAAVVVLLCFGLVSCESSEVPEELVENVEKWIEEYPWSEASDKVNEDTRWAIEKIKRTNRRYELEDIRGQIYEIECRSESGASELNVTLLVEPNTLEITDVESWTISGKEDSPTRLPEPDIMQVVSISGTALSPDGNYEVRLSGAVQGVGSDGIAAAEFVQICDVQTDAVLWESEGAYEHAVVWSPNGKRVALAATTRTGCIVTIIETTGWTAWNVELPEYTYLPDHGNWLEWIGLTEFRLTMGRGGDAGEEITYYFGPENFPVAGTSERSEDTQAVLGYVDTIYQTGMVALWGFLLPGTGPIAVPMDDFYVEVYDLFAGYEWVRWDGETSPIANDNRTYYFTSTGNTAIVLNDKRAYINVMESNSAGNRNTWYYAENEDGELLSALIDLWDGPDLYHAMFLHLDQISDNRELAETYVDWFQKYYLSTGAIEDIHWHETTIQDSDEAYLRILVRYSVKPVDLTNPAWQHDAISEDGWVDMALSIALEKMAPHRVSSYQQP